MAGAADAAHAEVRGTASGPAVVRSGLLSMLALAALGGTRLVHGSLVSHATDPETYGMVGTLIGIAMAAGLSVPNGLAGAAAKFVPYQRARGNADGARAVHRGLRHVSRAWAVLTGLAAGLGTAAVFPLTTLTAISAGALVAAFSLYSVEKGALYGFDRVASYVRLELIGSGIAVGSTIAIVAMGWTGYLVPLVLGYSLLAFGAAVVLRGPKPPREAIRREERREIAVYVALASIGGLTSFGFLQALPLLAEQFTSRAQVGLFVAGVTLVTPFYFLPRALGIALFPALAHAHGAGDVARVRQHTDLSTRGLLMLIAPTFAVAILLSRELLVLFGGAEYAGGVSVLQVLLAATCVAVSQVPAVNALSSGAARDVWIPVTSAVVGCATGLVVVVPLGYWLGGVGVATAYLVAVVAMQRPMVTVWRRYDMSWAGLLFRTFGIVVGALAIGRLADAVALEGTPRLIVDLASAAAVTLVALGLLRNEARAVLGPAVRRSLQRRTAAADTAASRPDQAAPVDIRAS
jgi:O-antigen/teichoic acid export membrane protein